MKHYLHTALLVLSFSVFSSAVWSQNAYVPNFADQFVSVINTVTQAPLTTIAVPQYGGYGAAISPDGSRAYISYANADGSTAKAITVINTGTNTVIANISLGNDIASDIGDLVEISPDGKTLYAGSDDSLYIISTQTFQAVKRLSIGLNEGIYAMAASPDGKTLYIAGDEDIYVLSTATNTITGTISVQNGSFYQLAVSADSKTLYGADDNTASLQIINVATKTATAVATNGSDVLALALTPNGSAVYMTDPTANQVYVISTTTSTLTGTIPVGNVPYGISITPDGTRVYVTNEGDDNVSVISTARNNIAATISTGIAPTGFGRFIVAANALPVKLTSFTAALSGNDVQVKWQTASEVNTSQFRIERSTDGTHFTTIGTVAATGGTQMQNYVFSDKNAATLLTAKTAYYRLQIADKDGSVTSSDIKPVNLLAKAAAVLLLPNPVKNNLTVRVSGHEGAASFVVTDMSGKRMLVQQATLTEGSTVSINTSALPAGTYLLRMEAKEGVVNEKFVKE